MSKEKQYHKSLINHKRYLQWYNEEFGTIRTHKKYEVVLLRRLRRQGIPKGIKKYIAKNGNVRNRKEQIQMGKRYKQLLNGTSYVETQEFW